MSTPLDLTRPFTVAQGRAAGMSVRELGRFRRLFAGVLLAPEVRVTPLLRAEAALLGYSGHAFASHATAARALDLPIPTLPGEHVTVLDRRHRHRRAGIACHHLPQARVTRVEGVPVSAPEQCFVELGTLLGLVDLVVVGDHLARRGMVTPEQLAAFAAETRIRGSDAARQAAGYVRDRVDSPMESRVRMLLVLAGLPEPEVNPTFRDDWRPHFPGRDTP